MKSAILLHGYPDQKEYYNPELPSASNSHWFPWLQKRLLMNEVKADTPEVFNAYKMQWQDWVGEVDRFVIAPETSLVGHSLGGGFWVRYLSEHPEISVDKVILVAPWVNIDREIDSDFFDFEIDPGIVARANEFIIFASDNDKLGVQHSVAYLVKKLPNVTVRTFHNYGHFTHRTLTDDTFPELLEALL